MKIAAIVLAAGPSSRMGEPKQMLMVDGEPLLLKTVKTVQAVFGQHVVVVLGANETEHDGLLKPTAVETLYNADWPKGMGASLKAGLSHLLRSSHYDAIVVLDCDQPYLTPVHVQRLLSHHEQTKSKIVASRYADTSGVPALFSHTLFDDLLALGAEEGAKKLIGRYADEVETIPFTHGEVDLDTPEQYKAFLHHRGRTNQ